MITKKLDFIILSFLICYRAEIFNQFGKKQSFWELINQASQHVNWYAFLMSVEQKLGGSFIKAILRITPRLFIRFTDFSKWFAFNINKKGLVINCFVTCWGSTTADHNFLTVIIVKNGWNTKQDKQKKKWTRRASSNSKKTKGKRSIL